MKFLNIFKKKQKLPFWLWMFSSDEDFNHMTEKEKTNLMERFSKILLSGKSIICLINRKPVRISFIDNDVVITPIENYSISF